MKTPEQLKGAIRNIAKEKDLHAQEVLQIFMFERILDRLSQSPYRKNFVLKGGLLIQAQSRQNKYMSHFCAGFVYNDRVVGTRELQKYGGGIMELTKELKEKVEKAETKEEAKKIIE